MGGKGVFMGLLWFVLLVSFVWLNKTNWLNQTNKTGRARARTSAGMSLFLMAQRYTSSTRIAGSRQRGSRLFLHETFARH